jgi:hypothetical protein
MERRSLTTSLNRRTSVARPPELLVGQGDAARCWAGLALFLWSREVHDGAKVFDSWMSRHIQLVVDLV